MAAWEPRLQVIPRENSHPPYLDPFDSAEAPRGLPFSSLAALRQAAISFFSSTKHLVKNTADTPHKA